MERIAFLIEPTGERIGCLLNPNSVVIRRTSGFRQRASIGGDLAGTGLTDDPMLYAGGGRTEIDLDLLFDVRLAGSTIQSEDVRDLIAPLWDLAENTLDHGERRVPEARLLWGKAWNILVVVLAVAERLEDFTASGAPQRSWLRIRLARVAETVSRTAAADRGLWQPGGLAPEAASGVRLHETLGGRTGETAEGERLDVIASEYYGDPSLWRALAAYNRIADPTQVPPGTLLRIPPISELRGILTP